MTFLIAQQAHRYIDGKFYRSLQTKYSYLVVKSLKKRRWSPEAKPEHLSKLFSQGAFRSLQVALLLFGGICTGISQSNRQELVAGCSVLT